MSGGGRDDAPRLIKWTGERCVPWSADVRMVYEHLHRYLWAADVVRGRRVLDLASGAGFGASILARTATEVVGVDIDARTAEHSSLNYASDRISFAVAEAQDLSAFPDGSFDAVVALEMIDHVDDQSQVLREIARVLVPAGLLILSTPDRRAYARALPDGEPLHPRELGLDEFTDLLDRQFAHRSVWGQRTISGSALWLVAGSQEHRATSRTYFVHPDGDDWLLAQGLSPMSLVAVASREPLPDLPPESTLADAELRLVHEAEQRFAASVNGHDRDTAGARREARDGESIVTELEAALGQREAELTFRRQRGHEVQAELAAELAVERARIAELIRTHEEADRIATAIAASMSWTAVSAVQRRVIAALGGPGSLRVRTVRRLARHLDRRTPPPPPPAPPAPPAPPPIVLPTFAQPAVSIVVPLFGRAELTEACLVSIVEHTSLISYEVILVDDAADPETKSLLGRVRGATVLVNETNRGYLHSVNRGAAAARGGWIVLGHNDIEVREGWLRALLDCGESAGDIGIVTPRYLFPDHTINEAGGIIWREATETNYGRGQRAQLFHWGHRREVDYGSAAALLVRAELWREVGGYDERYAPMYYEDADLAFQARERGWRVLYEPRAEVIHVEGATAGRDLAEGPKRRHELNRQTFARRWRAELVDQPRSNTADLSSAANRARGPRVLIIDHRIPSRDRDAASLRLWHMIDALDAAGCRITVMPDDGELRASYGLELQRRGVEIWHGEINVHGELATIGASLSLVILCHPHTAAQWLDLIRGLAPGARIVYDTIDLHWLRELRRGGGRGIEDLQPGTQPAALRELENAVMRSADVVLAVSEDERALIRADVPEADVRIVPTVHTIGTEVAPFESRSGVVFVGGFDHRPNIDAADRLVKSVMPIVWRRLGSVPVAIIGGAAPVEVRQLGSSLVDVTGWVPEIDPYLEAARVMVAPLDWGAGLKGKITQALSAGLPVVTTSVGAEGLGATDGVELLIADDDEGLAERVILALTDAGQWTELSRAGLELARSRFSAAVMARAIEGLLALAAPSAAGR